MARRGQFPKGVSGNPRGKAPGTRHRATVAVETLLAGEVEALTKRCIEAALDGDMVAMRLVLERIAPRPRGRAIRFDLPEVTNSGDLKAAALALLKAVSLGELSPDEASAVAPLVEGARKAIESDELARRLDALEQALEGRGG